MRSQSAIALACFAALGTVACDDLLGIDHFTQGSGGSTSSTTGGSGGVDTKLQVFVTSTAHDGAFSLDAEAAIDVADALCTKHAEAGGLTGRVWVAWLTNRIRLGMTAALSAFGPWHLVDGTVAVASYDDLVACQPCLAAAIGLNELGESPGPDTRVWTGTDVDGATVAMESTDDTCSGWTSNDATLVAAVGSPTDTSAGWTWANDAACNTPAHLYCFEIP